MKNILLNNGEIVTIFSNKDIYEVIGENFSYELAKHISEILWDQEIMDEYMTDIEKDNSKLKALVSEYHNHNLWNDRYFGYLCETGRVQTMEV